MGFMAAVAAVFALMTQQDRRDNDTGLKQQRSLKRPRQKDLPEELHIPPMAPLDMEAVKLLPSDADVLAGVHVAAALQNGDADELLKRDVPALGGSIEQKLLNRLDELTGLHRDQLDQVAVALRLRDQSVTVAVRTRSGYNEAHVLKRLKAEGETVYHFRKEISPLHTRGLLKFADRKSLLLAWGVEAKEFGKSEGALRPELVSLLKERIKPHGPVWIAGTIDAPAAQGLSVLLALAKAPEAERNLLAGLRSFALWLTFDGKPAVHGVASSSNENAGMAAEQYLRNRLGNREGVKLFRDREWVMLQVRWRE
jgi:hypothetical protein